MGIFDLPAKVAVLCAKLYNGKYGCSVCLHPGKRLANNARVYLPNKVYPQRTHANVAAAASLVERTGSCVHGVFSTLPFMSTLDIVNSIPVDYMHAVLEGVSRLLIGSWFDSKHHAQPCYVGHNVQEIDFQLLKQQPPSEFSRPPRSIQKHFKYWKASGTTKLAIVLLFAYYACTGECNFMTKKLHSKCTIAYTLGKVCTIMGPSLDS